MGWPAGLYVRPDEESSRLGVSESPLKFGSAATVCCITKRDRSQLALACGPQATVSRGFSGQDDDRRYLSIAVHDWNPGHTMTPGTVASCVRLRRSPCTTVWCRARTLIAPFHDRRAQLLHFDPANRSAPAPLFLKESFARTRWRQRSLPPPCQRYAETHRSTEKSSIGFGPLLNSRSVVAPPLWLKANRARADFSSSIL